MPRKRKAEITTESVPVTTKEDTLDIGDNGDSEPTELNRLISEEEYANGQAEVVVLNHTPSTPSPKSSSSRHNYPTASPTSPASTALDEDLDKISSEENCSREPRAPPAEDEDVVDESTCLAQLGGEDVTATQPHSGEYTKIMELLKEAEAEADPEYEEVKRRMEFLMKYNPRHPDSDLGILDYCCAFFQCFALCIEG